MKREFLLPVRLDPGMDHTLDQLIPTHTVTPDFTIFILLCDTSVCHDIMNTYSWMCYYRSL